MMAEGGAINYRSPYGVAADDLNDTTVRVCLVFPDVKRKKMKKAIANGRVEVEFKTRSIDMKLRLDTKVNGKRKSEHFQYKIRRLPHDIVPDRSKHEVEDGKVILLLHKDKPLSWVQDISANDLETDHGE